MAKDDRYIGFSREDRDLLIELRTSVAALRQDVYTIKDTISASVTDHETRIRSLESSSLTTEVTRASAEKFTRIGGAVLIFLVGIVEFVISKWFA